jgi:hypothetical protein
MIGIKAREHAPGNSETGEFEGQITSTLSKLAIEPHLLGNNVPENLETYLLRRRREDLFHENRIDSRVVRRRGLRNDLWHAPGIGRRNGSDADPLC